MTQRLSPFIEGKYGWEYGESGWNFGMDENLLKFSFLLSGWINGIVASLPKAVNGEAYFLTTDNRLYYAVSGNWFSSPTPLWKTVKIKSSGAAYTFNGTAMVLEGVGAPLDSPNFTGDPTVPDRTIGTSSSVAANTRFVTQSIANKPSLKFVEDFGAAGNGTTDDTAAIQAAITYSSTNKLPVIFTKVYKAAKHFEILQNTTLIGFAGAKIYIPSNVDFTGAPSYGGSVRAVHNVANIENVWIEGIDFYSDGNTGVYGATPPTIAFLQIKGLRVKDCKFRLFGSSTLYAQGFIAFGCSDVIIESSQFLDNSGDGCACAEGGANVKFYFNTSSRNGDWGFALSNGVIGAEVIGNTFEYNMSTATGMDECSSTIFANNNTRGNEHGIRIAKFAGSTNYEQFDFSVTGNVCVADGIGISIENASYGTVSANNVRGATTQAYRVATSTNISFTGNTSTAAVLESILLSGGSSNITFAANTTVGGTYGIRQVDAASGTNVISADNNFLEASIKAVDGMSYKVNALHLGGDGKPYFSGPISITSGIATFTASTGPITPPTTIYGYLPIQVGEGVGAVTKLLALYNP